MFLEIVIICKKREKLFKYLFSKLSAVMIAWGFLIVFMYFFDEFSQIVSCNKDSFKCYYYSATLHKPELRLKNEYDFSEVTQASIKKHTYYSKHRSRTKYKILMSSGENNFELPISYNYDFDYENDLKKIRNFLINPSIKKVNISKVGSVESQILIMKIMCIFFLVSITITLFVLSVRESQKFTVNRARNKRGRRRIKKRYNYPIDKDDGIERSNKIESDRDL